MHFTNWFSLATWTYVGIIVASALFAGSTVGSTASTTVGIHFGVLVGSTVCSSTLLQPANNTTKIL